MIIAGITTLLVWLFVATTCVFFFFIALFIWIVTLPFDPRKSCLHQFMCFWASLYTWINPLWNIRIEGRDKIKKGISYLLLPNHQSLIDIIVLYRLFIHFKWVSKLENFKIPFIGWTMALSQYIKIDRSNTRSAFRMLKTSEKAISRGNSLMMFPEGTRTRDGNLRPFREGAFTLALHTQTPILPIIINGTFDAIPKKSFVMTHRQDIVVRILDPIPPGDFGTTDVKELKEKIRDLMVENYTLLRSEMEKM